MAEDKLLKVVSFEGGMITSTEKMLIPHGRFSDIKNYRMTHPGFESRLGMAPHTDTADASLEGMTLYQFTKGDKDEKHFYIQRVDGSLDEATDAPPSTTVGAFGTEALAATANAVPASYGNLKDTLIYSDGVRQHQLYPGTNARVESFIYYNKTTLPAIPEEGEDYSIEVSDGQTSTVGVLSSLGTNAFFFVKTPVPAKDIKFTVVAANGNASVLTMQYWKGTWATVAVTDNTASGGATMAVTGTVTWTPQSDELPHYQFGQSGYWYKFKVSAALDASVTVSAVEYNADFQPIQNVWNGVLNDAVEAKVYDTTQLKYYTYGPVGIDLGKLGTDDYLYFSTVDPISGFYLDVAGAPNVTKATVTGSSNISFYDGGSQMDYIRTTDANFKKAGFETGQSITITGTVSNNTTLKIINVDSSRIWVETGKLTEELDKSATITFDNDPTVLDLVEVWTGSAWTSLATDLEDGTAGATKSGFVTWDRTDAVPQPMQFASSQYYAYWYRVSFDTQLSNSVTASIEVMPYFDISELGLGKANGTWKSRIVYTFDKFGQYLYFPETDNPQGLNGEDYGILAVGDGRRNPVTCIKDFHNELFVWQEEIGEEGGCTTLVEGYSPVTFGKVVLHTKIGCMNSKCAEVVPGVLTSTATDQKVQDLVFWLSRYGVMVSDGQTISAISDDVGNYFDPTKDEYIRRGYEKKMWLKHDTAYNVIRVGLVSGTSATVPNVFLVFDLADWAWSFDTLGTALSTMIEVEGDSGDKFVLQYGTGASDGMIYRLNTGADDLVGASGTTTAINKTFTLELDGGGNVLQLDEATIRAKAQTGDITFDQAINGNSTFQTDDTPQVVSTLVKNAGETYARERWRVNKKGNRIAFRGTNNVAGEKVTLGDLGLTVKPIPSKR